MLGVDKEKVFVLISMKITFKHFLKENELENTATPIRNFDKHFIFFLPSNTRMGVLEADRSKKYCKCNVMDENAFGCLDKWKKLRLFWTSASPPTETVC